MDYFLKSIVEAKQSEVEPMDTSEAQDLDQNELDKGRGDAQKADEDTADDKMDVAETGSKFWTIV